MRRILLLRVEAERISNKASKPIAEFADKAVGSEPYVYEMRKDKDGKCAFLKSNACSIYKIRPLICTFYPFELRPSEADTYVFSYTDECPCIGHGPKMKKEYFERLFAKSKALIEGTGNNVEKKRQNLLG
jgi:Fe-S-cluster containining protein